MSKAQYFGVEMDGISLGTFNELGKLSSEVSVVEFRDVTDGKVDVHKLPGNAKPPEVTLKRGKDDSMEFWTWHEAAVHGHIDAARRSCSLVMYSSDHTPVARYYLEDAWVAQMSVSPSRAGSSDVLIEEIRLVCKAIQRVAA